MKKLSLNIKKIALSLLVVGLAIGFQAFKNAENKLADGDYRFYNRSQDQESAKSNYVFRTDDELCSELGDVCSEVWNIGEQTPPVNGTELSSYAIEPTYVGSVQQGTYTGL